MGKIYEFKRPLKTNAVTSTAPAQPAKPKVPNVTAETMASQWHGLVMFSLQHEMDKACKMPEEHKDLAIVKHAVVFGEGMPHFGRLNIWSGTPKTVQELNGKAPPFMRLEVSPMADAPPLSSERTDICQRKFMGYLDAWKEQNPMEALDAYFDLPKALWELLTHQPFDLLVANYRMPSPMMRGDAPVIVFNDMERFLEYRFSFDLFALKFGH